MHGALLTGACGVGILPALMPMGQCEYRWLDVVG